MSIRRSGVPTRGRDPISLFCETQSSRAAPKRYRPLRRHSLRTPPGDLRSRDEYGRRTLAPCELRRSDSREERESTGLQWSLIKVLNRVAKAPRSRFEPALISNGTVSQCSGGAPHRAALRGLRYDMVVDERAGAFLAPSCTPRERPRNSAVGQLPALAQDVLAQSASGSQLTSDRRAVDRSSALRRCPSASRSTSPTQGHQSNPASMTLAQSCPECRSPSLRRVGLTAMRAQGGGRRSGRTLRGDRQAVHAHGFNMPDWASTAWPFSRDWPLASRWLAYGTTLGSPGRRTRGPFDCALGMPCG